MRLYLDASALVAVIADEPSSQKVFDAIRAADLPPLISDFCRAESSGVLARLVRTGAVGAGKIDPLYAALDQWSLEGGERVQIASEDVDQATELVRRHDLCLRAPDAIHITAARRLDATLLTLDKGMARAAVALALDHLNPAAA